MKHHQDKFNYTNYSDVKNNKNSSSWGGAIFITIYILITIFA